MHSKIVTTVLLQVITGQSMKDVARKVINHVRFSLLDPEYLNLVEKENELKPFIPVSIILCFVSLNTMYNIIQYYTMVVGNGYPLLRFSE